MVSELIHSNGLLFWRGAMKGLVYRQLFCFYVIDFIIINFCLNDQSTNTNDRISFQIPSFQFVFAC